jgi:hypothetical protein
MAVANPPREETGAAEEAVGLLGLAPIGASEDLREIVLRAGRLRRLRVGGLVAPRFGGILKFQPRRRCYGLGD